MSRMPLDGGWLCCKLQARLDCADQWWPQRKLQLACAHHIFLPLHAPQA